MLAYFYIPGQLISAPTLLLRMARLGADCIISVAFLCVLPEQV